MDSPQKKLYKFLVCLSIALLLFDTAAVSYAVSLQNRTPKIVAKRTRYQLPPDKTSDDKHAQPDSQENSDAAFYENVRVIQSPDDLDVLVNKYYELPEDYVPANMEKIASKYSKGTQRLRTEARAAFEAFAQAVYDHTGQIPKAISSYREYNRQNTVYLRYKSSGTPLEVYRQERDQVSARPGHSEHQLGLTVDVIRCSASVEQTAMYAWYKDHAHEYGFIIRYPRGKETVTGYIFEPWHLRYLGTELATAVFNSGLTYDEYCEQKAGLRPSKIASAEAGNALIAEQ